MQTKKHKIIFFGTSIFSVEVLKELKEKGLVPDLIVTTIDKPQGRRLILTPPPAKIWAVENHVHVQQFAKLNTEAIGELKNLNPDLFIVASYGKIIPQSVLDIPRFGALNVHPSILPEYRGPSPLQYSILEDSKNVGVTIIKMDAEMDHGPILAAKKVVVENWPLPILELKKVLAKEGADILIENLDGYIGKTVELKEQDHHKATYTKKIMKSDGEIDINGDAWKNYLKIQAFSGWPGTHFFMERHGRKIRVNIKSAHFDKENNLLVIDKVTPEGGKEVNYSDFLRGIK